MIVTGGVVNEQIENCCILLFFHFRESVFCLSNLQVLFIDFCFYSSTILTSFKGYIKTQSQTDSATFSVQVGIFGNKPLKRPEEEISSSIFFVIAI